MAIPDVPQVDLNRHSKEYLTLEIAATDRTGATVTPSGYKASFDGGTTWIDGAAVPGHSGWWQWLLAGPNAPDMSGATVITGPEWADVIVSLSDTPEAPAKKLATITLT